MKDQELWHLMRETMADIRVHYAPAAERFTTASELDEWTWGLLLAALTFEPETTSPARLQVRGPYTAAESYRARLARAAEKGYLAEVTPDEYRLTEAGRVEAERFVAELRAAMAEADPLSEADSQRLIGLLDRLVQASLETPPPNTVRLSSGEAWSIGLSYKLMPAVNPPLPYIEQAISCLAGYRDDAHLAAWQPSGLSATALESLTLLWRGEVTSLDELCERLAPRGHSLQDYAAALAELRARGFIDGPDATLRVTDAGRAFRDEIEDDTDHYFFAPWTCLSDAEKLEMAKLLTELRD